MRATWSNWSGSVTASPAAIRYPASVNEIIAIVRECRERGCGLRVVGAGHSFTPLAWTDGVLISLDRYTGLEHVDPAAAQATVRAGTQIKALGELLFAHGLGQANLGDIDVQSIAGAISTGTHGSGATLGSISTQVVGLTLVTAAGELLECSETHNREIFKAAQVSLGRAGNHHLGHAPAAAGLPARLHLAARDAGRVPGAISRTTGAKTATSSSSGCPTAMAR